MASTALTPKLLLFSSLIVSALAGPFPQQTYAPPPSATASSSASLNATYTDLGNNTSTAPTPTTTSPPVTTAVPGLTCTDGSYITTTTECTVGSTITICTSQQPQITCPPSSYPSTWEPERCVVEQTCFPVSASYLTHSCSNGAFTYSVSTLFSGTLAGETTATAITNVGCQCSTQDWYSAFYPGTGTVQEFCMPHTDCPAPMTTSYSTNSFCATADTASYTYCSTLRTPSPFCGCPSGSTAVYPTGTPAEPTGCAAAPTTTA